MATQALTLSIVACETSLDDIKSLISGCQLGDIGGTVNTKYRDYDAEDVLEALHAEGISVQRARHLYDDGASMLEILMYVPDSERARVDAWLDDCEALASMDWGVSIGDTVDMPEPTDTDSWNFAFSGNVIGFRCGFAQVEDGDGDVFDIEPDRLTTE